MQIRPRWRTFGSSGPPVWLVLTVVGLVALGLRVAFLFRAPVFIIGDSENYFWPGYQLAREEYGDVNVFQFDVRTSLQADFEKRVAERRLTLQ